tara:strand:+ start:78 stop:605 length:528 start_codon:yes stop_codon:yes gene_type:complete
MFTLGIPKRDYRRATQVLGYEAQAKDGQSIEFEVKKQDDDFYIFSFPDTDEKAFSDIAKLLDKEGVRAIGADEALTERKIMKLADLITEAPTQQEIDTPKWLIQLQRTYDSWQSKKYQDDKNKWEMFNDDIKDFIEHWEDKTNEEKKEREEREEGVVASLAEQKLRSLIRKTLKK